MSLRGSYQEIRTTSGTNVSNIKNPQVPAKPTSKITSARWKEISSDQYYYNTSVRHKFCALLPNESKDKDMFGKSNGLKVLMVSIYKSYYGLMTLNLRTFVKDDTSTWLPVMDDAEPAAAPSIFASRGVPKLILVRWEDGTETTVPPSCFIPPSTDYEGNDIMQVIKASDNPVNGKLRTGSVLPVIPPYKLQKSWSTSNRNGVFRYASNFKPDIPRKDYGGYEAVTGDRNRSKDGIKSQLKPNPRWEEGTLDFVNAENPYFTDEMGGAVMYFPSNGYKQQPNRDTDGQMVAEYFFDTTTNRRYAILYNLSRSYRYRVTNHAKFLRIHAKDAPAGSPAPIPPSTPCRPCLRSLRQDQDLTPAGRNTTTVSSEIHTFRRSGTEEPRIISMTWAGASAALQRHQCMGSGTSSPSTACLSVESSHPASRRV